eukprot:COSAG06_NODE_12398_length_1387_cov_0.996118_2_plen_55_part_00
MIPQVYDNLYLGNKSIGFYINTTKPDSWEIVGGGWAEVRKTEKNGDHLFWSFPR